MRTARALRYSAGISRTTRRLRRTGSLAARQPATAWRDGAVPVRRAAPELRLAIGVIIYLVFIFAFVSLVRAFPEPRGWPVILVVSVAAAFDTFCIADIVRASQVRYRPKWAWVLVCLAQAPAGGIVYLSVGRARRVGRAGHQP